MAARLNTCSTLEQHGVVRFLWAKDMAAKDIHKEMLPMYSKHCLSLQALPLVWLSETTSSGECLPDDDAVERSVCAWIRQQPQEFHAAGLQGLVKWWDKFLNLYGDYAEK
jgi:hypothetical protein